MARLVDEFKDQFRRQDNGLIQLILINVVVYVVMGIIFVVSKFSEDDTPWFFFQYLTLLPHTFEGFLHRPWTLFTYFFTHEISPFHILFNMLGLYWFGRIIHEFIGNRRLINIYLLGGIFGGLIYLILNNTVPFFMERPSIGMIGASGAVYAIAVAAATLAPDYKFFLIFIGAVSIKYIVAIFIFLSFIGTVGTNAGGNICHLGGALLGYLYIAQLKKGRDLGQPINVIARWIRNFRKPKMKVSYRKKDGDEISQKEIDAILDKINRSGYESLTKEEKQKLYKASQK